MDREQQLLQLHEFDEEVLIQAENAQSYATKSFLETLSELIQHGLEKQNDGTDAYKEELKITKTSIKAFSTILPNIFKTIGQNEAESRLWELTRLLMTKIEKEVINHENTGVKISAIKCLQVIVLLLSKSSQFRPDHRLLNIQELEKESHEVFKQLLALMKSDNESVLTATISCLVVIVRKRNNLLKPVANLFTSWKKTRSKDDSPVMLRNVEKALKLAFVSLIKTESLSPYRNDLITSFGIIGGNVAIFQSRHARAEEARRQKRQAAHQQEQQEREKRAKHSTAEYVPVVPSASAPNVLLNYDITQIPLQSIVSLCMTVLQNVPLEVMSERVSILPPEGVTLAITRPEFKRSSTPPYPPPPETPEFIKSSKYRRDEPEIKKEINIQPKLEQKAESPIKTEIEEPIDSDEEMEDNFLSTAQPVYKEEDDLDNKNLKDENDSDKPKVEVLASAEERASQALKMKPYALAEQEGLKQSEKKLFIQMSIQRIFNAINSYQSSDIRNTDRKALTDSSTSVAPTNTNSSKSKWFLLVAKLLTRGIDIQNNRINDSAETDDNEDNKLAVMDLDNDSSVADLKELLLNFIVDNLSQRHDLALDWLYEEYLSNKRNERSNSTTGNGDYFYWLHKLLEKIIPKLDAKDRILTKLLLDAPELDSRAIELVKNNLENIPERFVSCVSTLRSLVTNRPTIRYVALQVLLDLCIHENDKMRRTSIVAVKKWNTNQAEINSKVESYSIKALHELTTAKDLEMNEDTKTPEDIQQKEEENIEENVEGKENNDTETKPNNGWTEKDVVRHAELYFVLCTKKPSLLKELFSVYIQANEFVKGYIETSIYNMIKSIGSKPQDLNQLLLLVRDFPVGGETLVVRILSILCETKQPARETVSAVQVIFKLAEERSFDISVLSPILSGQSLAAGAASAKATNESNNANTN